MLFFITAIIFYQSYIFGLFFALLSFLGLIVLTPVAGIKARIVVANVEAWLWLQCFFCLSYVTEMIQMSYFKAFLVRIKDFFKLFFVKSLAFCELLSCKYRP